MMVVVSFGSIMSDYLQQRFTLSEIEAGDILVNLLLLLSIIMLLITFRLYKAFVVSFISHL